MEPEFWHQRWQDNLTGFHQRDVNVHLRTFWDRLPVQPGERVLVPLCGKSLDMLWLAERHPVLGVELSPLAVEAFFKENGLLPRRHEEGRFSVYEVQGLSVWCGDVFDLQAEQLQDVRAVYDRASLIALPPAMRPRFADRLSGLLPEPVSLLLVTMEYEQAQMNGPPFAVEESEVRRLFEARWDVDLLCDEDILAREPRFRERGLSRLHEKIYRLTKR